jgi:hypothetical protein
VVPSAEVRNRTGSGLLIRYLDRDGEIRWQDTVAHNGRLSVIGPFQASAGRSQCPPGRWEAELGTDVVAINEEFCVGQTWEISLAP